MIATDNKNAQSYGGMTIKSNPMSIKRVDREQI